MDKLEKKNSILFFYFLKVKLQIKFLQKFFLLNNGYCSSSFTEKSFFFQPAKWKINSFILLVSLNLNQLICEKHLLIRKY